MGKAVLILLLVLCQPAVAQWGAPDQCAELSYAEGVEAAGRGRTLVVLVGASWCRPCVAATAVIRRICRRRDIVFVHIDKDEHPDLARRIMAGANEIPVIVVHRRVGGRWMTVRERRGFSMRTERQIERAIQHLEDLPESSSPPQSRPVMPQSRPAMQTSSGSWRYFENGVVVVGDGLRRHLVSSHGLRQDLLSGLDDAELSIVHSAAHEGTLSPQWLAP